MRLLVLAEDFYPTVSGGAHEQWRFTQLVANQEHDVTVVTPRVEGTSKTEVTEAVNIVRPFPAKPFGTSAYETIAKLTRSLFSILLFVYLLWWLRNREIDRIYCEAHTLHWVAKFISIFHAMPLVSYVAYTPSQTGSFALTPAFIRERLNFRFCMGDIVFCRAPHVRAVISERTNTNVEIVHGILDRSKIETAIQDTELESLRGSRGLTEDNRLLVTVGRLSPLKNHIATIDMLAQLPSRYHLKIIGSGPERERIEARAAQLDVADRVSFAGTLPHESTLAWICLADALVLPSDSEAYPTVAFEGLALGCEVFATPVGILPECEHKRLHLAPVEEMAERILAIDPVGRSAIDEQIVDRYSMERFTDTILRAFEDRID